MDPPWLQILPPGEVPTDQQILDEIRRAIFITLKRPFAVITIAGVSVTAFGITQLREWEQHYADRVALASSGDTGNPFIAAARFGNPC